MEPDIRAALTKIEAKGALRSIFGRVFFADRSVSEPCWYRLTSARDQYIPSTEKPSRVPAQSRVFGISDKLSDELLLACGLLYYHSGKLRVRKNEWESLTRSEFHLDDVEVTVQTHANLIGSRDNVVQR
jgi:hypothetical protein